MAVRDDFAAGEVLAAADLNDTFASKLDLAGGKILQIVRATDSTQRSTTSTSFVDASISVTITPQKSDSAILLLWVSSRDTRSIDNNLVTQITDSSNNAISGAEASDYVGVQSRILGMQILIGYANPATTSATTYKGRFRTVSGNEVRLINSTTTGQLYAIEVSA